MNFRNTLTEQDLLEWRAKRSGQPVVNPTHTLEAAQPPMLAPVVDAPPRATAVDHSAFDPLNGLTQDELNMFDGSALRMLVKTATNAYRAALSDAIKAYERTDQRAAALVEAGLIRAYHGECNAEAEGASYLRIQCKHCGSGRTVYKQTINYCGPKDRGCAERADIYECATCNGLTRWQITTDNCGWSSVSTVATTGFDVEKERETYQHIEKAAVSHGAGLATVVDGVEYHGLAGACRANGVDYMTTYNEIMRHGGKAHVGGHFFEIKNHTDKPL
jgi:hypothetical protein